VTQPASVRREPLILFYRKLTGNERGRDELLQILRDAEGILSFTGNVKSSHGVISAVVLTGISLAQTPAPLPSRLVGTIASIKPDLSGADVKPDTAPAVTVHFVESTIAQRVAPGEKDLKNAEPIQLSDVAAGDRVLVVLAEGSSDVRRIVIMSAKDIAKQHELDRLDWSRRGVSGVVIAKIANEVTLRMRGLSGDAQTIVTVTPQTRFRRYAPDSVKFADARPSSLSEVKLGDQVRARGEKSADALRINADDFVFGTFLTKAGTIMSIDPAAKEIIIASLPGKTPLAIKITPDSQLKLMPDLPMGPPGNLPNGPPPGGGPRPMMDLSQMLEHMPSATLDDLKTGQTIVVSSTKGNRGDEVTAIMLLANAGMLIQMASAHSNQVTNSPVMGAGMSGTSSGLGGFELPGMTP
jgi:hypothetical protein